MTKRWLKPGGALLLPLALLAFDLSFRFPAATEAVYGERLYPGVVGAFSLLNRASFSLAEILVIAVAATALVLLARKAPRAREKARLTWWLGAVWLGAGALLWAFLLLWGFNYARPSLESRLGFETDFGETARPEVLLDAGRRVASRTTSLFGDLGFQEGPTRLPIGFSELDRLIDEGYRDLELPGDVILSPTAPAKPLLSSTLFSYLGISGIFVPFTGEPSVNALQPDVSLPLVVAHEKAHQRGITNEGEANFAAFLVCSRESAHPYMRYAAFLFATQYLIGEASFYLPQQQILSAWEGLGPGPTADVRAVREFWRSYEGRASNVAAQVNDGYLKALRVADGVSSYGTVVRMLLALDRKGELVEDSRHR